MKNFKFRINGNQYEVEMLEIDGNMARIEVNGTVYDVEMQRDIPGTAAAVPASQPVAATAQARHAPERATGKRVETGKNVEVKAPLPGVIIRVPVKPGDEIKKGQTLCTLETMKMENAIKSENDGRVTAVNITAGQSVLQDEILIVLSE
jgi:biotin carboxyl carrier protein